MTNNDINFSKEPLSPDEYARIRKMLRDDDRRTYATKLILTIFGYVGGVGLFLLAFKDPIGGFFKGLGGK